MGTGKSTEPAKRQAIAAARATILRKAAGAGWLNCALGGMTLKQVRSLVDKMRQDGVLFVVKTGHRTRMYFDSAEKAADYVRNIRQPSSKVMIRKAKPKYLATSEVICNVQVTVIPHGRDTRFLPDPGFRPGHGVISQDWFQRRQA